MPENVLPIIPYPLDQNSDGYPDNWPEISKAMKDWAGWKCEHCGHKHDFETGYVLTVHHLDGNKMNCAWTNLLVCCQRCHLHIQSRYVPGQLFIDGSQPIWAFIRSNYARASR